jgi:hypothetical protein
MTSVEAYESIADRLAELDPQAILMLKPTEGVDERVEELIQQKKTLGLSSEELVELERYLALDLLINMAKARARRLLA